MDRIDGATSSSGLREQRSGVGARVEDGPGKTRSHNAKSVAPLTLGPGKRCKVLDIGCGHGRHALELAARGHDVVGIDLVEGFLQIAVAEAKRRDLKLALAHADARGFATEPTFDGVICLFDAFGYFGDDSDRQVLMNIYASLVPGGRLLLDLRPREIVGRLQPVTVLDKGHGDMMIDRHHFDIESGRLIDRRTYIRNGKVREVLFSVRLYSFTEIKLLLQMVGFEVTGLYDSYGSGAGVPQVGSTRMLVLARK